MKHIRKKEAFSYFSIRTELECYEKEGIKISLEGRQIRPDRIAVFCILEEESSYMRDYIINDKGKLVEIGFNSVKNK